MYNYLTLLNDLEETLSMLMLSPVCCIVLNRNAELIDINKPACDLLKIENVEDYIKKERIFEMDALFCRIIHNFLNGKKTFIEKFQCDNGSYIFVYLRIELFFNLKDVFIFQFTQITHIESTDNSKYLLNPGKFES